MAFPLVNPTFPREYVSFRYIFFIYLFYRSFLSFPFFVLDAYLYPRVLNYYYFFLLRTFGFVLFIIEKYIMIRVALLNLRNKRKPLIPTIISIQPL